MSLRRGFKAESNRIALALRLELGLAPHDPLDLYGAARKLHVVLVPLSAFADELPDAVAQVTRTDPQAWSAGLLPVSANKRILLHNDAHSIGRQSSNIAHELAHVLLEHPCTLPLDSSGCRIVDRDVEEEANWLGGVLLVPDVAAVHIVRSALTTEQACDRYAVSADLLRMRINLSGARKRVTRAYQS